MPTALMYPAPWLFTLEPRHKYIASLHVRDVYVLTPAELFPAVQAKLVSDQHIHQPWLLEQTNGGSKWVQAPSISITLGPASSSYTRSRPGRGSWGMSLRDCPSAEDKDITSRALSLAALAWANRRG
jgi:hypothetical protein